MRSPERFNLQRSCTPTAILCQRFVPRFCFCAMRSGPVRRLRRSWKDVCKECRCSAKSSLSTFELGALRRSRHCQPRERVETEQLL